MSKEIWNHEQPEEVPEPSQNLHHPSHFQYKAFMCTRRCPKRGLGNTWGWLVLSLPSCLTWKNGRYNHISFKNIPSYEGTPILGMLKGLGFCIGNPKKRTSKILQLIPWVRHHNSQRFLPWRNYSLRPPPRQPRRLTEVQPMPQVHLRTLRWPWGGILKTRSKDPAQIDIFPSSNPHQYGKTASQKNSRWFDNGVFWFPLTFQKPLWSVPFIGSHI